MDESDALYGDLEATGLQEQLRREESENKRLKKEKEALTEELKDAQSQVKVLAEEKQTLENNILAIWNTATAEISRKDKRIADLNKDVVALKARCGCN